MSSNRPDQGDGRPPTPPTTLNVPAMARVGSFSSALYHQTNTGNTGSQAPLPPSTAASTSTTTTMAMGSRLPNPPTLIEYDGMRFLIMDAPSDANIDLYLREMRRLGVTDLVRVCDPTYQRERVEKAGIAVHEMLFPDGDGPTEAIVNRWLALVDSRFNHSYSPSYNDNADGSAPAIAVHCVAGLGRAPVLVAIALIEAGMLPLDAVAFLRGLRRGAINNKQLRFLENYRRRTRSGSIPSVSKCLLM